MQLYFVKVDQGKKRPNESAAKTPVSAKKAKTATPEKTSECIFHTFFLFMSVFPSSSSFID